MGKNVGQDFIIFDFAIPKGAYRNPSGKEKISGKLASPSKRRNDPAVALDKLNAKVKRAAANFILFYNVYFVWC